MKVAGRKKVVVDALKVMQTSASNVGVPCMSVALRSAGYSSAVLCEIIWLWIPATLKDRKRCVKDGK